MHQSRLLPCLLVPGLLGAAAVAQTSLSTIFQAGNSLNAPGSNQFDITVLNPNGIVVTGLDVNCENSRNGGIGSPFEIEIYVGARGTTYVGNQTNAGQYVYTSLGTGVSMPQNTPTPVTIEPFFLPPGRFAIAIQYTTRPAGGTAFAYTNGNGTNQVFANADLQLNLGSSCTGLFTGPIYDPRVWNGTIRYEAGTVAAFGVHGRGCSGGSPNGVPRLAPGAAFPVPRLGSQFELVASNLGSNVTVGLMALGLSFQAWGPFPLPHELSQFGMPGCLTYIPPDGTLTFVNIGTGTATVSMFLPNNPLLAGQPLGAQAIMIDPLATNPIGANISNLAAGRAGS